ncbi:unnamed protein product [Somion occarium]|uniref:Survival protein SurE-like phosphatase/nucleotidase domain-containing protein n=1 Tax=Somion occarium TaxID=3059160 RepID=A0ABP1CTB0_9APHY
MHLVLPAVVLSFVSSIIAQKIVLTNDDGWAVAQIRAQFDALTEANYDVILSAPAENKSGTGSSTTTPEPRTEPCQFNSCPAGSPAEGANATNPRFNYVNGFPVDSAKFGIQTLAPHFFNSAPDFVVSGPNVGLNTELSVFGSGTVGAACEGAKEGIPSIAFSGQGSSAVSYTTLDSDPTSSSTLSALFNANLTTIFMKALSASTASPVLPSGVALNVNFPHLDASTCAQPSDVQWVFARALPSLLPTDVNICDNGGRLPVDETVVHAGCFASVVVIDASWKIDVLGSTQRKVLDSLSHLDFACLPN